MKIGPNIYECIARAGDRESIVALLRQMDNTIISSEGVLKMVWDYLEDPCSVISEERLKLRVGQYLGYLDLSEEPKD